MGWQFRCTKCGSLLFDVEEFGGFGQTRPSVHCRGCDRTYTIGQDEKGNILVLRKGNKRAWKAKQNIGG